MDFGALPFSDDGDGMMVGRQEEHPAYKNLLQQFPNVHFLGPPSNC